MEKEKSSLQGRMVQPIVITRLLANVTLPAQLPGPQQYMDETPEHHRHLSNLLFFPYYLRSATCGGVLAGLGGSPKQIFGKEIMVIVKWIEQTTLF
jgi:hypothetical protein